MLCTAILTPHYIGFAHLAFHRSLKVETELSGGGEGGSLAKKKGFS